ncbi:hypothetical protein, partial [Staphylococcus aureus]|uniref:hypothetical protein n=1 Tax=Staphylococcus aureus TaxID=1280 RepID=UPI00210DEEF4
LDQATERQLPLLKRLEPHIDHFVFDANSNDAVDFNKMNDEQTTLNSQNYQDATPSKKTAYTNAGQAAKDILNKSNGQNKTKDQVTEARNQVNSAKNNLDGTRLLDQAKQTAKQQLNNMTHLTTAQKTNLTNQ